MTTMGCIARLAVALISMFLGIALARKLGLATFSTLALCLLALVLPFVLELLFLYLFYPHPNKRSGD